MRIFDNVTDAALEFCVWVIGGYPQVPWDEAFANVVKGLERLGYDEMRPTTLFILGRKSVGKEFQYVDLEAR